jgi:RimJ/RimL family protein N-acetyltransferase
VFFEIKDAIKMYKQLTTERLTIRPVRISDAAFILQLVNSDKWLTFIGQRNVYTITDTEQYIQKILDNPAFFYNVIELRATNQQLGIVTFLHRPDYEYPDIGFALLPAFEGNGYSFEAAKSYMNELVLQSGHVKIIGITVPGNTASIRILEKLGLTFQKKYRQQEETLLLYGISIH